MYLRYWRAGYVGSALVPKLLDAGYAVTVLDRYMFGDDVFDAYRDRRLTQIKGDIRNPSGQRQLKGVWA